MTIMIEEGKFYRASDGTKVGPLREDPLRPRIFDCTKAYPNDGLYHWYEDGRRGDCASEDCPDLVAEWLDEPEEGNLSELNVQPGDVVTFGDGERRARITGPQEGEYYPARWEGAYADSRIDDKGHCPWRIVSRASQPDTPKLWRDMTPKEKGALLLAHHEGKVIEWTSLPGDTEFRQSTEKGYKPVWDDQHAYRVRPEPKRDTAALFSADGRAWSSLRVTNAKWRQTYDIVGGKPDPASIRMEEL